MPRDLHEEGGSEGKDKNEQEAMVTHQAKIQALKSQLFQLFLKFQLLQKFQTFQMSLKSPMFLKFRRSQSPNLMVIQRSSVGLGQRMLA